MADAPGADAATRWRVRAAQAVLLLAFAGQLAVPDRGRQFALAAPLFLAASAGWMVATDAVLRRRHAPSLREVVVVAAALLAAALLLTPQLSDDVHRYVFEGRLVCAGLNPYATAPSSPEVPPQLCDGSWQHINNRDIAAAYPPAVQLAAAAGVALWPSALGVKLAFGACALLAVLALWWALPALGAAREQAVVFAWCPLPWLECAGEGHGDALAVLPWVVALALAARARPLGAGVALAVAAAARLLPAVALPWLARGASRARWAAPAAFAVTVLALYLPFVSAGSALWSGLGEYAARWRGNDTGFALVYELTEMVMAPWRRGDGYVGLFAGQEVQRVAKLPLLALGAALLVACWRRRLAAAEVMLAFTTFFLAFAPTVHPWYAVLWLPWLCLRPNRWWLAFCGTVYLAYHVLPEYRDRGVWRESGWWKAAEYAPFYAGCAATWWRATFPRPGA